MIAAAKHSEAARADLNETRTRTRHDQERRALLVSEYGADQARRTDLDIRGVSPRSVTRDATPRVTILRTKANEIRVLPVNDAAG